MQDSESGRYAGLSKCLYRFSCRQTLRLPLSGPSSRQTSLNGIAIVHKKARFYTGRVGLSPTTIGPSSRYLVVIAPGKRVALSRDDSMSKGLMASSDLRRWLAIAWLILVFTCRAKGIVGERQHLTLPGLPVEFTKEFRRYYDRRRVSTERLNGPEVPDQAIENDLDLMLKSAARLLKEGVGPNLVQSQIEASCEHAIGASSDSRDDNWQAVDEYGNISLSAESVEGLRFITARMGAATKTVAFDHLWRTIELPVEFAWNLPWDSEFRALPNGMILVNEWRIEAAGFREDVRLIWLRVHNRKTTSVGRFQGVSSLDCLPPKVRGNRVELTTVDEPKTFIVSDADTTFMRFWSWDCSGERPCLTRNRELQRGLRAVDDAIWQSWHARRPTSLQRRIRQLYPEADDSGDHKEWRQGRKGVVTLGNDWQFQLRYDETDTPRVVSVRLVARERNDSNRP